MDVYITVKKITLDGKEILIVHSDAEKASALFEIEERQEVSPIWGGKVAQNFLDKAWLKNPPVPS